MKKLKITMVLVCLLCGLSTFAQSKVDADRKVIYGDINRIGGGL
jgi:hypothetical protein